MTKKTLFSFLCFFLVLGSTLSFSNHLKDVGASALAGEYKLVLYDANLGTVPGAPLMNFIDFPADAALPAFSDGLTVMDTTTLGGDTYAGWLSNGASISGFPILDRIIGYQVDFTLQVEDESHANNNRAGFSIIILGQDAMGVELAFWETEIWAQGDGNTGGLFKHSEGINFPTATSLTDYQVVIVDDSYTLIADTNPILTGPLRDYSGFEGFPDPYETPNFLFLGDNTTSAQARIQLSFVSITGSEPVTPVITNTSTNTSLPLPTASFTQVPVDVSTASPPPAGKSFELCPSGWILLIGILTATWMSKKIRGG
jgi:hypothetical protein